MIIDRPHLMHQRETIQ